MRSTIIIFTCFWIFFPVLNCFSQNDSLVEFAIYFEDKDQNPYNLDNPESFLSEKAIERRENQGISLQKNDLPVTPSYTSKVKEEATKFHFATKWLNATIVSLKDSGELEVIRDLEFVDTCQRIRGTALSQQSDGELINDFPDLRMNHGKSYRQIAMMNGHLLHHDNLQGQNQLIAVLDGGFRAVDDLNAFYHLNLFDLIKGTQNYYEPNDYVYNFSNHGSYVLSLMGGFIKNQLIGSAPVASYLLLRSEFVNSEFPIEEYAWVKAAEFADSAGASIINSSLGYKTYDDSTLNYSYEDMDGETTIVTQGASIAANKGILVVSSAGNEGNNEWQYVTAPADADSILTVGAVDSNRNYAAFSSTGPTPDGRIKPDVVAMGQRAYVTGPSNNELLQGNGTSFSAPLVSGLAACLWQAFPEATNMEIRNAIIHSASQSDNPDTLLGYGIPDFYQARKMLDESINNQFPLSEVIKVYPNPAKNQAKIKYYSNRQQSLSLRVINPTGKVIQHQNHDLPANETITFQLRQLGNHPPGIYVLLLNNDEERFTRKFVIED